MIIWTMDKEEQQTICRFATKPNHTHPKTRNRREITPNFTLAYVRFGCTIGSLTTDSIVTSFYCRLYAVRWLFFREFIFLSFSVNTNKNWILRVFQRIFLNKSKHSQLKMRTNLSWNSEDQAFVLRVYLFCVDVVQLCCHSVLCTTSLFSLFHSVCLWFLSCFLIRTKIKINLFCYW